MNLVKFLFSVGCLIASTLMSSGKTSAFFFEKTFTFLIKLFSQEL